MTIFKNIDNNGGPKLEPWGSPDVATYVSKLSVIFTCGVLAPR